MKGKGDQKDFGHHLSMSIIIDKNRKIMEDEKMHKEQVIRARMLRIKVG